MSAVAALVGLTEELGRDAGLEVNKAKSRRFGVPESIATGLALEEGPPVADWCRDLGVVQAVDGGRRVDLLEGRFAELLARSGRVGALPVWFDRRV